LIASGAIVPNPELGTQYALARKTGNPSVGPSRAQPWNRGKPCLTLDGSVRVEANGTSSEGVTLYDVVYVPRVGRPTRPIDLEALVDPEGFRQSTIDRRLRKYGYAA
jgi:hypothetical protein